MQVLHNNTPTPNLNYIDDIDFLNNLVGYEHISGDPAGHNWMLRRYVCLPGGYERNVAIISDVGAVMMTLGSFKVARTHLNKLDDSHKVYLFASTKEMWGWMRNAYTK